MAKVDIYHYGSPTSVTNVTLSNCDSTNANDYAVMVQSKEGDQYYLDWYKPSAISGSTLTLTGSAVDLVTLIMVTQQG